MPYDKDGQGPPSGPCENSSASDHKDERKYDQGSCPIPYSLGMLQNPVE